MLYFSFVFFVSLQDCLESREWILIQWRSMAVWNVNSLLAAQFVLWS